MRDRVGRDLKDLDAVNLYIEGGANKRPFANLI